MVRDIERDSQKEREREWLEIYREIVRRRMRESG